MNTKITFHFILADNDVDGDDEAFTNGALEEICKLCIGHYGLFDGTEVKAKITNASIMDSCGATKDGRQKRFIYAEAEFPNNECGRKLISKILLEKPIASIACSALNRDKVADDVTMISNVTDFYNFSLRFDEEKETMNKNDLERRLEAAEKQMIGLGLTVKLYQNSSGTVYSVLGALNKMEGKEMEETIAERIHEVRMKAGMSQKEFARAVFVSRLTVYRWERGKSVPYAHDVQHIAQRFHVSCDYLILGADVST